jgi:hypothetical protein
LVVAASQYLLASATAKTSHFKKRVHAGFGRFYSDFTAFDAAELTAVKEKVMFAKR